MDWKNAYDTPAFGSLDEWLREEAKDGRKFESVMFAAGNHLRGTIVWSDGTRQEIVVGERSAGQVCVLARRQIEAAAAPVAYDPGMGYAVDWVGPR